MTAQILDGKTRAAELRLEVAQKTAGLDFSPGLAVVLIGEDPASQVYVRKKIEAAEEAGFKSIQHYPDPDISQKELLDLIGQLNRDARVHGILVQLPLPDHIDAQAVIDAIDPDKDVDGFTPINAGRLFLGLDCFVPCTPQGCMILIRDALGTDLVGRNAVMVGKSNIVGKPMAQMLMNEHCTVSVLHSATRAPDKFACRADILVVATGVPGLVTSDWVKEGACVIDVGISRVDHPDKPGKTKLAGDVDFDAVKDRAGWITPVPGGVGPMTIACLLQNTLDAALRLKGVRA